MPAEWTVERVLALAPDDASAKAGRGLASTGRWASLGRGDGLIWGECLGSGAKPYQTKADPGEAATSCSCPSRKFPCKHALGLMLIWAAAPESLREAGPPEWVASWKESREKKAEKAKEKVERSQEPVEPVARAKREASREAKVAAGLDDFSLWLSDLVRQGFSAIGAKTGDFWDQQARRMVDAQAPGVARRLRQIERMPFSGEGWQSGLLDQLARLHLLNEGFKRCDGIPSEVVEDLRAAIGFPSDLDAVRAGPGVRDHWQVIGQAVDLEGTLSVRRTWLIGRDTGRPALLLSFAAVNKPHEGGLPPGTVLDAEIAFFPGSAPLRALVKERYGVPEPLAAISGGRTIAEAFAAHGAALAKNPWLELTPVVLDGVQVLEDDGVWSLRDAAGATIPIANRSFRGWHLLAVGGGSPLTVCGEFDGSRLEALGAFAGVAFLPLRTSEAGPRETTLIAPPPQGPWLAEATASAIVGVDRRPLPKLPSDDPIGTALSGQDELTPPSRLLAVAAAAGLYGRVGRKPVLCTEPTPSPSPRDEQPECTPAQALRLSRLCRGEYPECLPEWVALLADSGRRLPHDAIVDLLERLEQQPLPVEQPVRKILGVRGRWLASQNLKWRKLAGGDEAADPSVTWESGEHHERTAVLRSLRAGDPARARELVASTFAREPADKRAAFLAEFSRGLSMDDEPFLEGALDDRGKEVRRRAGELLRRLPESRLCLRMIERVRACLRWKPGLLGIGAGSLVVELPSACDEAALRDGAEAGPGKAMGLGERAWWLHEFVSAVPPKAIAAVLGVPATRIVDSNAGTDWESILWSAWAISTARHVDADWAEILLKKSPVKPSPPWNPGLEQGLFASLPADRRDGELLRRLRADPDSLRPSRPTLGFIRALTETIGVEAGREILSCVRRVLAEEHARFIDPARREALHNWSGVRSDHKYHDAQLTGLIVHLGAILPTDLVDEVAGGLVTDELSDLDYAHSYAKMLDRLQFRRDMYREFAP